ncbi:MAG: hypothetical protein EPN97_11750 [Alphaproteobacteria bacterium]|nr:MAG: hypothetical protein EPN97_11750 [Alphaproteobacteria bacterium]
MMGFDPVSMMAAGYILAAVEGCPAQDAPTFDVQVQDAPPVIDESHSSAELTASQQAFQVAAANSENPLSQYVARDQQMQEQKLSVEGAWFTGGYTMGRLGSQYMISYKVLTRNDGATQTACVYIDKVTLAMKYNPEIYIASEWSQRPCAHQVINAHEHNHVSRDLWAISQFLPRAKILMTNYLSQLGGEGPMDASQVQVGADALAQKVTEEITTALFPPLEVLRAQLQRDIDTAENYQRESTLCPAEEWRVGP